MALAPLSVVVLWPRGASVVGAAPPADVEAARAQDLMAAVNGATLEPALAKRLAAHLGSSGTDWAEHVRALDKTYGEWLPGAALARDTIATAQALIGARRFFARPRIARPTLPVSVATRAVLLRSLAAKCIYLDDDMDGLGVVLAAHAEVTVYEPDPERRAWLIQVGGGRVEVVDSPPARRDFDLAVAHAGEPGATHAMLSRVLAAVRDDGHIALSVRSPWDPVLFALLADAGLPQHAYVRDVDHWLLPSGHVVDGGGDVVIVTRPAATTLPALDTSPASLFRQHPFFTFDIDALSAERVGQGGLDRFADRLAVWAPRPEGVRVITRGEGRETLCWYDQTGVGLSAELRFAERHLMVTLMPNDPGMELAAMCAAYVLFADEWTRPRPLRTRRGAEEMVFG